VVGLTWTVRASSAAGTATPPAGDGAEPAATADKRKAAVDAAKAFVSEYHANAAAVKYKITGKDYS
jgi:hypothetical protein